MTSTTWTTTTDVPPSAWAALVSDVRTLLGLLGAGGATVTDPTGKTAPVLGAERIAFTVTLPDRGPLTVVFTRDAGDGGVDTSSPITDGLVLAAVHRAAQHWGQLLTVQSDAGTTAREVAATVVEGLFGAQDRAVAGGAALAPAGQVALAMARAQDAVSQQLGGRTVPVVDHLGAVIAELAAQRAGILAALSLLPKPPAVPDAPAEETTPVTPPVDPTPVTPPVDPTPEDETPADEPDEETPPVADETELEPAEDVADPS